MLIFTLVKLPYGTVGDIYTPLNLQFAVSMFARSMHTSCAYELFDSAVRNGASQGMYPAVVIVLINLRRSNNNTIQWKMTEKPPETLERTQAGPTASGDIQFARSTPLYLGSVSEEALEVDGRMTVRLAPSP